MYSEDWSDHAGSQLISIETEINVGFDVLRPCYIIKVLKVF